MRFAPRSDRRAFTLLELIVVIVILGLLAALAIPTFQGAVDRSAEAATRESLESVHREVLAVARFDGHPDVTAADIAAVAADLPAAAAAGVTADAMVFVDLAGAGSTPGAGEIGWALAAAGLDLGLATRSGAGTMCYSNSIGGTSAVTSWCGPVPAGEDVGEIALTPPEDASGSTTTTTAPTPPSTSTSTTTTTTTTTTVPGVAPSGQVAWAAAFGNSADTNSTQEQVNASAVGADGTVYLAGRFSGTATLFGTTVVSAGGTDMYVAAVDPDTRLARWVARGGAASNDNATALAVTSDGVYVGGAVSSGTPTGVLAGGTFSSFRPMYVAALDPGTGASDWLVTGGGYVSDSVLGLAADSSGVYVTGKYQRTPSGFLAGAGDSVSTTFDAFVAALDPVTGTTEWAQRAGGTTVDEGRGVAITATGVYVAGVYSTSPTGFLSGRTAPGPFVAAFDRATGTTTWVRDTPSSVGARDVYAIAVDGAGVYVTGSYDGDPGGFLEPLPAVAGSYRDAFVVALDPSTGTTSWSTASLGVGDDYGRDVAAAAGVVYVTGDYTNTPTGFLAGVPTAQRSDQFVAALHAADGTARWVTGGGSPSDDFSEGIAASAEMVVAVGTHGGTYGSALNGFLATATAVGGYDEMTVAVLGP